MFSFVPSCIHDGAAAAASAPHNQSARQGFYVEVTTISYGAVLLRQSSYYLIDSPLCFRGLYFAWNLRTLQLPLVEAHILVL